MTAFIDSVTAPVGRLRALTPAGIDQITELHLRPVQNRAELPLSPGPYVWAESWEGAAFYFGSASGARGLAHRVGNEMRWKAEHLSWLGSEDPFTSGAAMEVPLIRTISELDLTCFIAEARPATWSVHDGSLQTPVTAQEWERFIQETSSLLTGHRSLVGGGAWENKAGQLGERMQEIALHRIRELMMSN